MPLHHAHRPLPVRLRPLVLRSFCARLALVAGTLALVAGGCSEVIGLGPEPVRARIESEGVCGLPAHPSEACDACLDERCCAFSLRCFESDDGCAEESQCAVDCAYDTACLNECVERYNAEAYSALQGCLVSDCLAPCLPSGPCSPLIGCCQKIPRDDATFGACADAVNRNVTGVCQGLIDGGTLDTFCPELTSSKSPAP